MPPAPCPPAAAPARQMPSLITFELRVSHSAQPASGPFVRCGAARGASDTWRRKHAGSSTTGTTCRSRTATSWCGTCPPRSGRASCASRRPTHAHTHADPHPLPSSPPRTHTETHTQAHARTLLYTRAHRPTHAFCGMPPEQRLWEAAPTGPRGQPSTPLDRLRVWFLPAPPFPHCVSDRHEGTVSTPSTSMSPGDVSTPATAAAADDRAVHRPRERAVHRPQRHQLRARGRQACRRR